MNNTNEYRCWWSLQCRWTYTVSPRQACSCGNASGGSLPSTWAKGSSLPPGSLSLGRYSRLYVVNTSICPSYCIALCFSRYRAQSQQPKPERGTPSARASTHTPCTRRQGNAWYPHSFQLLLDLSCKTNPSLRCTTINEII